MNITIQTHVTASAADTWRAYNNPDDILRWDSSDDWHTTSASNDLKVSGNLVLRIEPNNGGEGFDVVATYLQVEPYRLIEYREANGRTVRLEFLETATGVSVRQTFDADPEFPEEEQCLDWQSVLNRFARYVERHYGTT